MRVELRDGQWAELRERISHGQDKHLKRTWRISQNDPERYGDMDTELIRAYVTGWSLSAPLGDIDGIDSDDADTIAKEAAQLWTGVQVPNEPTPDSSDASSSD